MSQAALPVVEVDASPVESLSLAVPEDEVESPIVVDERVLEESSAVELVELDEPEGPLPSDEPDADTTIGSCGAKQPANEESGARRRNVGRTVVKLVTERLIDRAAPSVAGKVAGRHYSVRAASPAADSVPAMVRRS